MFPFSCFLDSLEKWDFRKEKDVLFFTTLTNLLSHLAALAIKNKKRLPAENYHCK